jgi:uncharacterized membrane protein YcaP (DUF421 family)
VTWYPGDWSQIFALEAPVLALIARASALYFGLLVLVRVMPRRTGGELAMMDLIFVLLIAEAASHALGDFTSVGDGFVVIATLMAWNWLVNMLSFRIPALERLLASPPIAVIRRGRLLRRNMRREYLTEDELMSHLREQGIDRVERVKLACVEGDGRISVVQAGK